MTFLRRVRLVFVSACLCATSIPPLGAQTQTQQPAPAPQQPVPTQQQQTPAPRAPNPFENVPQAPPAQQPTPPAEGQPQLETPKPAETRPSPQQPAGQFIEAIEFRGARRVPQDTLKAMISTKQGDVYNDEMLRRDFMQLWNTGRFDDIRLEVEPGRIGLIVRFMLTERRVIRTIDYVGIHSVTVSEILDRFKERSVGLTVESQYDQNKIQRGAVVLREFLGERGHEYAEVEPVIEQIPPSSLKLTFKVKEGPKVKVGKIDIVGNRAFTDRWIVSKMKNLRPMGIPHSYLFENLFSKTYDIVKLEDDKERLRQAFQDKGYWNARALDETVKMVRRGGHGWRFPLFHMNYPSINADLTIPIEEGRQYKLRNVTIEGVKFFRVPSALFTPLFRMGTGDVFQGDKLRKGLEEMRKLYGNFGFIDFVPEPNFDFIPDTDQVDVTLTADEGKQFFVRRIDFSGNTTTRDKVIRRELLLDEGDMFNMSMWEMSILRLNQLGYFEMLKKEDAADIKRNPQSNTVDITLKVKERGKNTIGLNGGVSGIAGSYMGFNYSTNNFLGLGETLSLDAQVGTRLKDVSLGFTEPYLFDRPIQAGAVVYIRRYNYDQGREASILAGYDLIGLYNSLGQDNLLNYRQNSKGFTASISTHLRRSFAQIGLTYGYDSSNIITSTTASKNYFEYLNFTGVAGPTSLSGIRTSSVTPSYSYNTVNHPITPTAGRSIYLSTQFSGSVLGGNVNSVRPAIDLKYFKIAPWTKTHVLAFHGMASIMTGYGGKVAPPYSRSFIGGEQDVRGFENYGVTPIAFIPSSGQVYVYNDDGTQRTQKTISGGKVTNTAVTMTVPTYQLITPGGYTQMIGNFEYRMPLVGPVSMAAFYDIGLNKILLTNQLKIDPSRVSDLNALFPQAGFDGKVRIASGTQKIRMSTGLEFQVMLPILQAPFRVYFAYNPSVVRQYLQPPIVADRASYPNYTTFYHSIATFGQAYPFYEKRTMFRFTVGRTF